MTTEQVAKATFREVFAVSEFRALWSAQLLSVFGDQLARVALTILVYERTRSSFLAAVTFVTSIVPTFVGGLALSWLADRYPRRTVMICCDLARATLILIMAIPGMPLAPTVILLFAVTFVGAPFTSARAAMYPDVLDGDRYVMGTAVTLTTNQFAQVIGFAVGGTLVGFLGARTSLLLDAATFAFSAALIVAGVAWRPAPQHHSPAVRRGGFLSGALVVFSSPQLAIPMLFGWLAGFYNSPEAVAAPLASSFRGGAATVGVILAAQALGESLGVIGFSRLLSPSRRLKLMGPLSVITCGLLTCFAAKPALGPSLLILTASGAFGAYQVAANAAFVQATPQEHRSQAFGLAQGGMSLGQGAVFILAGAAAQRFTPAAVITVTGAVGTLAAIGVTIAWFRARRDP